MSVRAPYEDEIKAMVEAFTADLERCIYRDEKGVLHPIICSVCDTMWHQDIEMEWVKVEQLVADCNAFRMTKATLDAIYPERLIAQYTVPDVTALETFVLSPKSVYNKTTKKIAICVPCVQHMKIQRDKFSKYRTAPKEAIINGYLIGNAPPELTDLNQCEVALLSTVRTNCQSWIFFAGCHRHIQGWHTFYENRPANNAATIANLADAGLKGQLLVVLCGPFTPTQRALTMSQTIVRHEKVIAAYEWLKKNNYHYRDIPIPHPDDLPVPQVIDDELRNATSTNVTLENEINITVVFPDSTLPTTLNGGFENQEAFRDFVLRQQRPGTWQSTMHARPSVVRLADYEGDALAKAFPLLFPYGHSGSSHDEAVITLQSRAVSPRRLGRTREHVMQKYLLHRISVFHGALFNLIVSSIMMKQTIFESVRLHANFKNRAGVPFAEGFGNMTSESLHRAITAVRHRHSSQYASNPESQFLRSVSATCGHLPHSNEASAEARKRYFSMVNEFGLPAVFLTVTPDDSRNYRIVLYALNDSTTVRLPTVNVDDMTDNDIIAEFNLRAEIRTSHPGLCAEEYYRIMMLVIKHFFKWDHNTGKSTGHGLFGELIAWTLATEEQGRKTLHGHFLLFVKNWQKLLREVQLTNVLNSSRYGPQRTLVRYCSAISSAKLFEAFDRNDGLLKAISPFEHDHCLTSRRDTKKRRVEFTSAPAQQLRDMRHKVNCKTHKGAIGKCSLCLQTFTVPGMATATLQQLLGEKYHYPDDNRRLDQYVYNMQQDWKWYNNDEKAIASRYFVNNTMVNIHHPLHAKRCFKNNVECYANLPENPLKNDFLHYKEESDDWYDFKGCKEDRYLFRFYDQRNIEDTFTNVHSPVLTACVANNTNIKSALNGPVMFYCTGYQAKSQQKMDPEPFVKLSQTLTRIIPKPSEDTVAAVIPPFLAGMKRMLAGVYVQTSAHIIAAPMAHFLARHESRFMFSHPGCHLPAIGIENFLMNEATIGTMRMIDGKSTWYHKAMDYIHRPPQFEHLNVRDFFRQLESKFTKTVEKLGCEMFNFTNDHPFEATHCIVYRPRVCVPIYPWTFLESTSQFEFPLTHLVSVSHPDFAKREEYCRRFLILFVPFRDLEQLKGTSQTFQAAFKILVETDQISHDAIRVANNNQDIHNSIRVTMPPNMLTDMTELEDTLDEETQENNWIDETLIENIASVLAQIQPAPEEALMSFATNVSPQFLTSTEYIPRMVFETMPSQLANANTMVYQLTTETPARDQNNMILPEPRFRVTVIGLNSLVYHTLQAPETATEPNPPANATGTVLSIKRWCEHDGLDEDQQFAVEIMVATYVLTFYEDATGAEVPVEFERLKELARRRPNTDERLRMFITGPAGAGKCKCNFFLLFQNFTNFAPKVFSHLLIEAKILATVLAYCRAFSEHMGHHFTSDTIKLSAMTGSAGVEIGGDTTARVFGLNKVNTANAAECHPFADTRLNIVDEVGFASHDDLTKLSTKLQEYTQCNTQIYGSIGIVFIGDFCQLPTIGGKKIYEFENSIYWEQALNQMVILKGHHRYAEDPELGNAMATARNGDATNLRIMLRERVINQNHLTIPRGVTARYASYTNKTRASINANIFRNYLQTYHHTDEARIIPKGALVIRGTGRWGKEKTKLGNAAHKTLWEHCSDSHVKNGTQRADPFLCVFRGSELMVTDNICVKDGIANGTCCQFEKAVLKPGQNVEQIQVHGRWVNSVDINNIDHIVLRFDASYSPKFQGTFKLKSREHTFQVEYPMDKDLVGQARIPVGIKLVHFPIVGNFATTGHKLQGKTMENLVIAEWNQTENWAYVVLSRVRTLAGIFLTEALPDCFSFDPKPEYLSMMERLQFILATAVNILYQ